MKPTTKRAIFRWIHLLFGLTLLGYIYGPPEETVQYIDFFRYFYVPVILLSGFWMWKGDAIQRLFSKKSA